MLASQHQHLHPQLMHYCCSSHCRCREIVPFRIEHFLHLHNCSPHYLQSPHWHFLILFQALMIQIFENRCLSCSANVHSIIWFAGACDWIHHPHTLTWCQLIAWAKLVPLKTSDELTFYWKIFLIQHQLLIHYLLWYHSLIHLKFGPVVCISPSTFT